MPYSTNTPAKAAINLSLKPNSISIPIPVHTNTKAKLPFHNRERLEKSFRKKLFNLSILSKSIFATKTLRRKENKDKEYRGKEYKKISNQKQHCSLAFFVFSSWCLRVFVAIAFVFFLKLQNHNLP